MLAHLVPLISTAARLHTEVLAGERASAALSRAIGDRRLPAEDAERLSGLVYGTLRRRKRARAVLMELGSSELRASESLLLVLGAALFDGRLDAEGARELVPDVPWSRWQEADESLLAASSAVKRVELLGSLPDWLAEQLVVEYGAEAEPLAASLSEPAPRALRVNALSCDVAEAHERLEREGARIEPGKYGKRALLLEGAFNPFTTRAFHDGVFELQDEASQVVCELVAPPPRGLVVDACAGAGGKTLAVAAQLAGRGKVLSLDIDEGKLTELRRRAKRAGAVNVQAIAVDEQGPLPEAVQAVLGKAERLLIDAPCSGTGVLRRNPEARARLTPDAVTRLAATQRAIVERMLPVLAPGGRLLFATCSLLRAEGEDLLDAIEAEHAELSPVNLAEVYDRAYIERFVRSAPHRARLSPHRHGTDGFFVACLRKKR
jgi:16S rRNA (cytosine967-C5)-methyltransferase